MSGRHDARQVWSPGALTDKCSPVTGDVRAHIKYGMDVGPSKVSGLDFAIESLRQVFSVTSNKFPATYGQIRTAGMLCVRRINVNPTVYSNHSCGTAIDLYFGSEVVRQGKALTQRGFLDIWETLSRP
jgi:hypothetical protein